MSAGHDEFLRGAGHLLRTRMNSVIGMAELALETRLTKEQSEFITAVASSAETLRRAVDELIDLCRIQSGELILDREKFRPDRIVSDIVRQAAVQAGRKGPVVRLDMHPDLACSVIGDAARLRQITAILIESAVADTATGKINVAVEPFFQSQSAIGIHVKVTDNGPGFAPGEFERLIEPFDDPNVRPHSVPETGLSLALANRLVGLMGGCLWMEPLAERGSAVHFTVTFARTHETIAGSNLNKLRGVKVLVAGGTAPAKRVVLQFLGRLHMKPALARSAGTAISMLKDAALAGAPFAAVLTDTATAAAPAFGDLPARADLGRPALAVLSSFDIVLGAELDGPKRPFSGRASTFSYAALLKTVGDVLCGALGAKEAGARRPAPSDRPAHVLVAEDNAVNEALAVRVLLKEGYRVSVARTGKQALEVCQNGDVDLVLMDVQMPGLSGIEATRLIRQGEAVADRHTPIIALTGHASPEDRRHCIEAGMDDHIGKPLHVQNLRQTVRKWLGQA